MLSKRDIYFCILTGFITGFSVWRILDFLNAPLLYLPSYGWLMIIIPVIWILGVSLGYALGGLASFFRQFGKFAVIGFTNSSVDIGILNLLIFLTGIHAGWQYVFFKGVSFLCAIVPSYILNKYWAFSAGNSTGGVFEFSKFMSVALTAIFVNTTVASIVVNYVNPVFGIMPEAWATVGAVTGSATALIFSFLGFKLAVFKK
ncbi:MAG: hypothetical protein A3G02_00950 [Candidatus Yanofskybacteria bacterium RIFCSPLOWO2_12_FULL_44_13b]|uniref:Glycosyl transferase family 2 n=3 Tax=Parcubacteria group TaxID=1794811 RepID=A0A0G0XJY7_9BACT|nr:MAG: Glycosyl transferase family 2 [Candidatus Wolfebacteria bacterium GW2011_GWA2_42_10]KKT90068.1 MAG: Glycosyl transferase family 2 [Candidatus Yanofskybacteria bacterium GW2011_GWB1_45_11]OGN03563.1 MAG: hypothetical protein A2657_00590 [Candidatus Yanofskybacteria bacterium RIFCSPHIGHO2_01_FULL_44_110b]OGN14109.1 MAG: hypothetical protein A3C01_00740 [Candidatus Yanofskybacteria bacterium RIFCSPHIGHO2_02_FULL_44_36b]OGN19286.1 MAG: hypothetical protein A3F50_03260 [Candidatus Yanofskyba